MAQQLLQILQFTNVAPGATVQLPHNININGTPEVPDLLMADQAGIRLSATETIVEFTNNTGGLITQSNVWVEHKHSIPRQIGRAFGNPFAGLSPRPFVPASSSDRFPFMEANVDAAGSPLGQYNVASIVHVPASGLYTINLTVPLPAPGGTDNVVVAPGLNTGATPGMITYEWASTSQLLVRTFSAAGAPTDFAFSVGASLTFRNF
jgi:hypothetical protein